MYKSLNEYEIRPDATTGFHGNHRQGCHASGKSQGNLNFFQGQGIVREFSKLSVNF